MNIILILGSITPKITNYIKTANGVSINVQRAANTVDEIEDYLVKTLTKTDLLVIADNALGQDYMRSLVKIKSALDNGYLTVGQIIHLNLTTNKIDQATNHLLSDYNLKIIKREQFTIKTILEAVTGELQEFSNEHDNSSLVNVVRTRKNSRDNATFEESQINQSVIITTKQKVDLTDKEEALKEIKEVKGDKKLIKFSQKIASNKLDMIDPSIPLPDPLAHKIPDIKTKTIAKGTTLIVTGERKSGKTVFSSVLAKEYSKEYKVLYITDTNPLSEEIEKDSIKITVAEFKENLQATIQKTTAYKNKLTILNDFRDIPRDTLSILLDIIYFNTRENYDLIIVDTQLTKLIETQGIASSAHLICITSPLYTSTLNSTVEFISSIKEYLPKTNYLYVPTNIFHSVGGLTKYTISTAKKSLIDALNHASVQALPELKFQSLNVGSKLLDIVTPHIDTNNK